MWPCGPGDRLRELELRECVELSVHNRPGATIKATGEPTSGFSLGTSLVSSLLPS